MKEFLNRQGLAVGRNQDFSGSLQVHIEQGADYDFLALEMVVKIARADIQFYGNIDTGNIGLTLLVKHLQTGEQDLLGRFHNKRFLIKIIYSSMHTSS